MLSKTKANLLVAALRFQYRFVKPGSRRLLRTWHTSKADNVFHCCIHKTGSQWLRHTLHDPVVYRASGLMPHFYQAFRRGAVDGRPLNEQTFPCGFPPRSMVSPLYMNYENFAAMPKPEGYRALFVFRDPRDLVISHYFSMRYSHRAIGNIPQQRAELSRLNKQEGIRWMLARYVEWGNFDLLRSWVGAGASDERILLVRYEDLVGTQQREHFRRLFRHCDVALEGERLDALLDKYSFSRLSGRERGHEDPSSKFRKGVAGDWRNHFDAALEVAFREATGDLLDAMGYSGDNVAHC